MSTQTKKAETRHSNVDAVFAAIEDHGSGVGMVLLWMIPILGLIAALARSWG